MYHTHGFLGSLFDFNFSSFVTPVVIKILYVLAIILVFLIAVGMVIQGFDLSTERGVITLVILAPLYFFVSILSIRIGLELVMVIFRIGENIAKMSGQDQAKPFGMHQPEQEPPTTAPPQNQGT